MAADSVLIVTQNYWPEEIGSAPYCVDIADWLAAAGGEVRVLTGLPHYPDPAAFAGFNAAPPRHEVRNGVAVTRLRSGARTSRTVRGRIAGEAGFLLSGLLALLRRRVRREEMVVSLCPSILTVLLGIAATRRGGRHVALVHDIQSGLAGGLGMVRSGLLLRAMRVCERLVLNRTDLVVVLTAAMRVKLRALGVRAPIEVLPIWVDTDAIRPLPPFAGPPTLLYSGNLGRKQGLEQMIALAGMLQQSRPDITVLVRGAGPARAGLLAEVAAKGLSNLQIEPLLPREQLAAGLGQGSVHLVPQNPEGADFAVPSKIFGIMAAGRTFVATAQPGSTLDLMRRESGGFLCVPPQDTTALAAAAGRLVDDPDLCRDLAANGRRYVERVHAKAKLLARFAGWLTDLSREGEVAGHRRSLLVFEPDEDGHPREWIQHLLNHALEQTAVDDIWLVLAPGLAKTILQDIPDKLGQRVHVLMLQPWELRLCTHRRLAVSGFARWWTMRRHLARVAPDIGYFLSLDHLSLPLALGFGMGGHAVGGILFRPSVHYAEFPDHRPTWRERLRDWRKSLLYPRMLRNRDLRTVLTLDPFFPDYAAQAYAGGEKVLALPDPAYTASTAADAAVLPESAPERVTFLIFGVLTARKGILRLLDALLLLPPDVAARMAVVIAGKVAAEIAGDVAHRIAEIGRAQPALQLQTETRHLSSDEIDALVERCDVVLAPYQRFVGSSGVLLWAASRGRPLLAQDYGLVGRLTADHGLGLTVDTTDATHLAGAIARMVEEGPARFVDAGRMADFVAAHTPAAFADGIFRSAAAA